MSLLKYILTESKKSIIIRKIGLPETLAEHCLKYYDKKFVLYWASALSDIIYNHGYLLNRVDSEFKNFTYEMFISLDPVIEFKTLEVYLKKPTLPQLPKNILNKFKKPSNSLTEHMQRSINYLEMYVSIKDYNEGTNQNFQNRDFEEVYRESVQWHEEIKEKGTSKTLQLEEGQEIIHEFDDGYYWVDLGDNKCEDEGGSMGHCGRTDSDTLLSLRDSKGVPHVTVACNYFGTASIEITQMKGKGNKKPIEKYHPYIYDFIVNGENYKSDSNQIYEINSVKYEYNPEEDFHVTDLSDEKINNILKEDKKILLPWFTESIILILNRDEIIDFLSMDILFFEEVMELHNWSLPESFRTGIQANLLWELEINKEKNDFEIRTNSLEMFFVDFLTSNELSKLKNADKNEKKRLINNFLRTNFATRLYLVYKDGDDFIIPLDNEFGVRWVLGYEGIIPRMPFE